MFTYADQVFQKKSKKVKYKKNIKMFTYADQVGKKIKEDKIQKKI